MTTLTIGIVAGEESGDLLGADAVRALIGRGYSVRLVGVGGRHLQALGLKTLFDPAEIALMGITEVVTRLPRLIRHIGQTARAIAAARPDLLLVVDNPDFTLRVARRVRAALPDLKVIDYVCPSVWAWRPQRAPAMAAYVDLVLCLLPFEPAELARLGGPRGVHVGHRLTSDAGLLAAKAGQSSRQRGPVPTILALPGSRRGEISALVDPFGAAIGALAERIGPFDLVLPTLPRHRELLAARTAFWPVRPAIVTEEAEKWAAFGRADAALAASGTVLLELALAGVPAVSCYRVDWLARMAARRVTVWSAALPNIIADRVVVSEYYNEMMRPGLLARRLQGLAADGADRAAALDGLNEVRRRMATERPAGEIAADAILTLIGK